MIGNHRIESIGDRHQTGTDGDFVTLELLRISFPIVFFVVIQDDVHGVFKMGNIL